MSVAADSNAVIIDGSRIVQLPDGQVTTVIQSDQEPITISRSGSVYIADDQTLPPGQQVTVGRTTASLGSSTGVLYVNGAPTTLAGPLRMLLALRNSREMARA